MSQFCRFALVFAALVLVGFRPATGSSFPERWRLCNRITITEGAPNAPKRVISITPSDMLIEFWEPSNASSASAKLLLTRDRFFATRGLSLKAGQELVPLSQGLVDYLLVIQLLERGAPEGPAAIEEKRQLQVAERNEPIVISIPGDRVVFPPPWALSGDVERVDDNSISFALNIQSDRLPEQPSTSLHGTVGFDAGLLSELPSSTSLEGWSSYEIKRLNTVHLGQQGVEYWAFEVPPYKTLGDLRAHSK